MKSFLRLTDSIQSRLENKFSYGTHDCCAFSFGCARDMMASHTDFFYTAGIPEYESYTDAQEIIDSFNGLEKLVSHICESNGFKEVSDQPKWGDIVVFLQEEGPTVGIVLGENIYSANPVGVSFVPSNRSHRVWRAI